LSHCAASGAVTTKATTILFTIIQKEHTRFDGVKKRRDRHFAR
jgi:hypothetical protein